MNNLNFFTLFSSGGYSLPALVELKKPESTSLYFTNNDNNVRWGDNLYLSVPMSYKPPSSQNGVPSSGTIEIIVDIQDKTNNELLQWFDTADDKVSANVVAIINRNGVIDSIGQLNHQHGTVSWDGRKITWNIGWDDRLDMQINPWEFTAKSLLE